ncbi:MAG: CPBP family intramembrane glutamic endopeptidase [Terracidiphilus sp.]
MEASDSVIKGTPIAPGQITPTQIAPAPIASWGWLAGFLAIGAGVVLMGFMAQHAPAPSGAGAAPGQLARHSQAIPIYLSIIGMDWALLFYCWSGVRHHGGNLWTLSWGRWNSWKSLAADLGIALPFWLLWEGAAYGAHWLLASHVARAGAAKTVDSLLPQSLAEVLLWALASITAGICEEMAFRGFLQRQFHALTGNLAIAVVAQGAVFGLFHAYQGWVNVVVISFLGMLFGAMAAWRGNLRVNIVSHAFTDFWEGWLKFVIFR